MPFRQKSSYQLTSQYNSYLGGWAFAFSVVLVTLLFMVRYLWTRNVAWRPRYQGF